MAPAKKINQTQLNPYEAFKTNQDAVMSKLNCHNIGRIIEFDPDTFLCTVEIQQLKQFYETSFQPVPITQVPLIIYGSDGAHITLPNPVGTICLLLFLDRDISNFLLTGEVYDPSTTRMHDFSDCIALTTFKTLANPIQNYDERAISIIREELIEDILCQSIIKVYGDLILQKAGKGAQIQLDDKLNLKNNTQSLASLIQAFLTACENITTVADESGGTLTPQSKQAFTNLKTSFEELLK